jgi:DNA invertase Pin-like site-specific DNA recombinase
VTSERIRDKIAASKRKGLWVGGMVPLGYETKDQPANQGVRHDASDLLNRARERRILVQ